MDPDQLQQMQQKQQHDQQQQQAMIEQREAMLNQIFTPAARERLHRVSLVKPEKVRQIEDEMLHKVMRGQHFGKIQEQQLISMLEQSEGQTKSVKIVRKRGFDSDDDDNDDDLLQLVKV